MQILQNFKHNPKINTIFISKVRGAGWWSRASLSGGLRGAPELWVGGSCMLKAFPCAYFPGLGLGLRSGSPGSCER